jgi:23S rRNA (adenine2503-C2)-methyltransferase
MQIEHVRQRLRAHGAKPCHEEVLLRSWAQALPFDSGQRGGQKPRTGAVEAP